MVSHKSLNTAVETFVKRHMEKVEDELRLERALEQVLKIQVRVSMPSAGISKGEPKERIPPKKLLRSPIRTQNARLVVNATTNYVVNREVVRVPGRPQTVENPASVAVNTRSSCRKNLGCVLKSP